MISKILCSLGWHRWERWRYEPRDTCNQARYCSACDLRDSREFHEWDPTGVCARCNTPRSCESHEWGDWEYGSASQCHAISHCRKCRQARAEVRHARDEAGVCHRCGDKNIHIRGADSGEHKLAAKATK